MFDKYIEKNISRQVYLCERLYEKRQLRVKEVAEKNDVCSATIHHDLAVLQERFPEAVVIKKCGRDQYQADFALSLPELRWQLCRESDFLRCLRRYLVGEASWQEIAEAEFISQSKVYQVRSQVQAFFEELGYQKAAERYVIPEKDYRSLLLALDYFLGEQAVFKENQQVGLACEQLISYVEQHFFLRRYPENERRRIFQGIKIGIERGHSQPVVFPSADCEHAARTPLFQLLQKGLQTLDAGLCCGTTELYYLYSLFNARSYLCNNFELLKKDFAVVSRNHLYNCPQFRDLVEQLQSGLGISADNELLFTKALLSFVRSSWGDLQVFQTEQLYLLSPKQLPVYQKLLAILEQWCRQYAINSRWNQNLLRKLAGICDLLTEQGQRGIPEVYIVAPTDFAYLYYRQKLELLLDERLRVSDMICNRLEELTDDVFFCGQRLIFCDASLYQADAGSELTRIFPITMESATTVILEVNRWLYQTPHVG